MNLRQILSGLLGAAVGLGLLWTLNIVFFSKSETPVKRIPAEKSSAQQLSVDTQNADNTIEVTPIAPPVSDGKTSTSCPFPKNPSTPVFKAPQDPVTQARSYKSASDAMLAGDAASTDGNKDLAVACFRRAVELDPKNITALQALAMSLMANDKVEETVGVYEKILAINPGDKNASFNLAVTCVRLKKYDRAEKLYEEILESHPDDIQANTNMATLLQIQDRLPEAKIHWQKVVSLDSKRADAWDHLGEIAVDLGQPQEAMDAYSQTAKITPDNPVAWKNFAITAHQAGSDGRAIFAYKKAIELEPKNPDTWKDLGNVLLEVYRVKRDQSLKTQAVAAWQESLKLKPDQDDVKQLLSVYAPQENP